MRKIFFLFCLLSILVVKGQEQGTVEVVTAGTLQSLLEEKGLTSSEQLKLIGNLNGADIRTIRHLCGGHDEVSGVENIATTLRILDLSDARIVEGGGNYYNDSMYELSPYRYITSPDVITWYMFAYCSSLEEVTLPKSVHSINAMAFYRSGVKTVNVSEGTVDISRWAYYGCSSLSTIILPSTVQFIDVCSFAECPALCKVISNSAVPPTASEAVAGDRADMSHCLLLVPAGSIDSYSSAFFWKDFESVGEIVTGIRQSKRGSVVNREVYDVAGRRIDMSHPGLKIIRQSDGNILKIR